MLLLIFLEKGTTIMNMDYYNKKHAQHLQKISDIAPLRLKMNMEQAT